MQYSEIQNEISRIQFHSGFDMETKNRMIKELELKLEQLYDSTV